MRLKLLTVTLGALLLAPSCISPEAFRDLKEANERLVAQRDDLKRGLSDLERRNQELLSKVERAGSLQADEASFRKKQKELDEMLSKFRSGAVSEVEGMDVFRSAEGVVFSVQGEILFNPGQVAITDSGKQALRRLVPTLNEHIAKGHNIRIDGHTDSDPIVRSQWKTNLRLSSERAMSVVQFLTSSNVDAEHVFVAAFGEHRPTATGADDASKRANRRVEILLEDR